MPRELGVIMAENTPSYVMYADLKRFGRVSNYEAARLLLSGECRDGERLSPRDRIEDRTFLSRRVVNAAPGELPPDFFEDAGRAAQSLVSLMLSRRPQGAESRASIERHYAGEAPEAMCRALRDHGIDANVYRNLVARVSARDDLAGAQRTALLLTLFLVMGCRSDPGEAVARTEDFVSRNLLSGARTAETSPGGRGQDDRAASGAGGTGLGLMRLFPDGSLRAVVYRLSEAEGGTVVGSLACEPGSITDVDADVSRRHLRIVCENGRWYAEGLGSTNGTAILAPGSDTPEPLEEPRSRRADGVAPARRRIRHGDVLLLGATTRFLVVRLAPEGA